MIPRPFGAPVTIGGVGRAAASPGRQLSLPHQTGDGGGTIRERDRARLVESVADITLVAPPDIPADTRLAGKKVLPVGRLRGHLWEQVSLPLYLRSLGSPTLIDLANTGPLLWQKQLYTLHDVAFITQPDSYRPMFRLAYRVIAGTLVRRAAHVVTVSSFSRDEIVRVFRCPDVPIDIVPNAVSGSLCRARRPRYPARSRGASTFSLSALPPPTRTRPCL